MAEWNWDWTRNQPPPPLSLFGLLPGMTPLDEAGIPGATSAPPVLPDVAKNRPPVLTGPGYNPAVVGNPKGTALQPALGDFGNPAPTQPAETEAQAKARILKSYLENKDFMGGLAAIAKGAQGKGAPAAPIFHVSDARMGQGLPDHKAAGGQLMAKALGDMLAGDLTKPLPRKSGAQARYDILGRRQTQDLSELFKNLV